jgi:hypothetical protein
LRCHRRRRAAIAASFWIPLTPPLATARHSSSYSSRPAATGGGAIREKDPQTLRSHPGKITRVRTTCLSLSLSLAGYGPATFGHELNLSRPKLLLRSTDQPTGVSLLRRPPNQFLFEQKAFMRVRFDWDLPDGKLFHCLRHGCNIKSENALAYDPNTTP